MKNTHNSNELLSHLFSLKDTGYNTIPLGYLLGSEEQIQIPFEHLIVVLQPLGSVDINFKIDNNKQLSLDADQDGVKINFEIKF